MPVKAVSTAKRWPDPDDAPALTKAWFDEADMFHGGQSVRRGRGRPKGSGTKVQLTLRIDQDVVAAYKATGTGWQTRVNEALRATLPAVRRKARRSVVER